VCRASPCLQMIVRIIECDVHYRTYRSHHSVNNTLASRDQNSVVLGPWIPAPVPSRALQGIRVFAGMTDYWCIELPM
jgi:hypothetical protein